MSEIKKQWYVVRAIGGKENKVKEYIEAEIRHNNLEEYISQVLIPTEKVYTIRNGKKVSKEKVSYPGYVLVEAAFVGQIPIIIRNTPNVLGFLGDTKEDSRKMNATPLRPQEVARILGRVDEMNAMEEENEIPFFVGEQRRGYLFEEFLKKLFLNEGIEVTEPFKIVGEQIDGSIKYDGEHYIIEAKWHDKWSASDSLYQFAAKVEGKMYGRGVFISVNGFSPDSVQALTTGKALRTILVDGGDLVPITEGMYTLREMLDNKIKAAQTMGRIYVDSTNLADKVIRQ